MQDEDVVALECPDPAVLAFRVRLLNRIAERVGNVPAAPRPRPVLAPPHHASSAAQAAKVRSLSTPDSIFKRGISRLIVFKVLKSSGQIRNLWVLGLGSWVLAACMSVHAWSALEQPLCRQASRCFHCK